MAAAEACGNRGARKQRRVEADARGAREAEGKEAVAAAAAAAAVVVAAAARRRQ